MTGRRITIEIHQGDITQLKADACVSSIHRSKDLNKGILAGHISRRAGSSVQLQLNQIKGDLEFKQIVSCTAGKLTNFKTIIFACLLCWQDGNEEALFNVICDCLVTVSDKGYQSIALPALGMGGLHYPPFEVAMAMLEAVTAFMYARPKTSIEKVIIALNDPNEDSIRTFVQSIIAFGRGVAAQLDYQRSESGTEEDTWLTIEGQDLTRIVRSRPERVRTLQSSQALTTAAETVNDMISMTQLYSGDVFKLSFDRGLSLSDLSVNLDLHLKIRVAAGLRKLFGVAKEKIKKKFKSIGK